eukprot:bmy_10807T0
MASVSTHENQDKGPHLPPPSKQSLLFCPKSKLHIHKSEISKIIRECQEESFWKRALPFSLVSMLVTQGLVHHGYLAANPRFGSLPKVARKSLLAFLWKKFGESETKKQLWHCLLTCEECKTKHGLSKEGSSQPSTS